MFVRRVPAGVFWLGLVACGGAATASTVMAPTHTSSSPSPVAGQPCAPETKLQCADPTSALICRDGKLTAAPCRGHGGCRTAGDHVTCDESVGEAGDVCTDLPVSEHFGCTRDLFQELVCAGGVYSLHRTCHGPKGCSVNGDRIHCDDSLADEGELCAPSQGDDDFACSRDMTDETICDQTSRKFVQVEVCRGPRHCAITDGRVHCDTSVAREGEPCRHVNNHACSEDGTRELQCADEKTWRKQRDCPKSPCNVQGRDVYCN
jgi:hypothetical protein